MKKTNRITGNTPKWGKEKEWSLDIGSGGTPNPHANVFLERYMKENSHRLGSKAVIPPNLVIGDWHHLPFKEDSIDFVCASSVIEHVENPIACFRETLRVLKDDCHHNHYEITCPTAEYEVLGYFLFKEGLNPTHRWIFTRGGVYAISYLNHIKLSFRQQLLRWLPIKIKMGVYTHLYGVVAGHVLRLFGVEVRMQHLDIGDYLDFGTLKSEKEEKYEKNTPQKG